MKKLAVILTLFSLTAHAQDSLYWVGTNHPLYTIQKGFDTTIWNTIGTLKGNHDSNYSFPIIGPTYYYRVYADQDTSPWMLAYSTLVIVPDSVFHPIREQVKDFDFKVWQIMDLQFEVKSERPQQADVKITDMLGQTVGMKDVRLSEGTQMFTMPAPMTGVYAVSIQTYFDYAIKKIFVR